MTGLDPDKEKIIEIATLITDSDLNVISEGPNLIISQPKEVLDEMDDWNQNQHGSTGLIDEVNESGEAKIKENKSQISPFPLNIQPSNKK